MHDSDNEDYLLVEDFIVRLRQTRRFGKHVVLASAEHGDLAGFPWWDHAEADLRKWEIGDIPGGTAGSRFSDLDQGWIIEIWQREEEGEEYVFVKTDNDPSWSEFPTRFRVRKSVYVEAWRRALAEARGISDTTKSLQEALANPEAVKTLLLGKQWLGRLPEEIGRLENLEHLELFYNELTTLPESIGNLRKLRILDLRFNKISDLPSAFALLQNLQQVNLGDNEIRHIPECVYKLPLLREFWLCGNPVEKESRDRFRRSRPDVDLGPATGTETVIVPR